MKKIIFGIILFLQLSAHAQTSDVKFKESKEDPDSILADTPPPPVEGNTAKKDIWQDLWLDFRSPWDQRAARYAFFGGTAATGVVLAFQEDLDYRLQDSVSRRKPLGSSSKFGDVMGQLVPNAAYALGMWAAGDGMNNSQFNRNALVMVKATAFAGAVTTVLKYTVRERRPDQSNRVSFPSGHSATAFAFASVVGCEHDLVWAIPSYGLAAFVGFSRINDNKHYLHDVLAGATIGTAYGIGVCMRDKEVNSGVNASAKSGTMSRWFKKTSEHFFLWPAPGGAVAFSEFEF